jgi:hypothetical protein
MYISNHTLSGRPLRRRRHGMSDMPQQPANSRWGGRPRPLPDPWSGLVEPIENPESAGRSRTRASGAVRGDRPTSLSQPLSNSGSPV